MQAISETKGFKIPKQEVLDTFVCDGCGEHVRKTQFTTQDQSFVSNVGCKCEDLKLARSAEATHRRMLLRKAKDMFNQNSLVNKSLQRATFESYQPPTKDLHTAKKRLISYAQNFDPEASENLLLAGSYGTGKSHLSYATVKALVDNGFTAVFLSVPKLLTKIKDTYNGKSSFSEAELLEYVQNVDLLVLDDVGTEYTNLKNEQDNWTQSKLFEVMDSRSGKHTIYTTNLSSDQLEKKVNERNFSRMMDNTEIVKMNGADYRRKQF